jgi:hypothetical protein
MRTFMLLIFLLTSGFEAFAKKPVQRQAPIEDGCIRVDDIGGHNTIFGGSPWLQANVQNHCQVPVRVFLTIAWFDKSGTELGTSIASETVAGGARWVMQSVPNFDQRSKYLVRGATIIKYSFFPDN